MSKNKTRSGAERRFYMTGLGEIMREQTGVRHLLKHKSNRKTRRLTTSQVLETADVKCVRHILGIRARIRGEQQKMACVKRPINAKKKHRTVLKQASGYCGQRSRMYRKAKEQVTHSFVYPHRGRKAKKGDSHRL